MYRNLGEDGTHRTQGLYGGLFIKLNMRVAEWRTSTRFIKGPVLEVLVVTLLTAMINYPNVFMRYVLTTLSVHMT